MGASPSIEGDMPTAEALGEAPGLMPFAFSRWCRLSRFFSRRASSSAILCVLVECRGRGVCRGLPFSLSCVVGCIAGLLDAENAVRC